MGKRLTIPDVVERFAAYKRDGHAAWGSLHIVLDDGNVDLGSVVFCEHWATEHNDKEGANLAAVLALLTRTQRSVLPDKVDLWLWEHREDRP